MKKLINALAGFLMKPVSTGATVWLGLYTICWGLWIACPVWDVFPSAHMFRIMTGSPEWVWGLAAIICGAVALYSTLKDMPRTLFTCAAITGWYWMVVAIVFFLGDWHNTGGLTAAFVCLLCIYIYLNQKINHALT